MRRSDLQELTSFIAVARLRNFRHAAAELKMSPSALSHAMRSLEARFDVRLLNRTTRSVSLTDAGSELLERIEPAFADIAEAVEVLQTTRSRPRGRVRVSVPKMAAHLVLAPALGTFARQNPEVIVEISVNDAVLDIVESGFDAGIRLHESVPRDMVAVPITPPLRGVVVGAPAYLRDCPAPHTPQDLSAHRCIVYRYPSSRTPLPWAFEHETFGEVEMSVEGPLIADDMDLIIDAALQGVGLALVTEARVGDHVTDGRLVRVLDDWCRPYPGFCLYFPTGRHMSGPLRALVDHLRWSSWS